MVWMAFIASVQAGYLCNATGVYTADGAEGYAREAGIAETETEARAAAVANCGTVQKDKGTPQGSCVATDCKQVQLTVANAAQPIPTAPSLAELPVAGAGIPVATTPGIQDAGCTVYAQEMCGHCGSSHALCKRAKADKASNTAQCRNQLADFQLALTDITAQTATLPDMRDRFLASYCDAMAKAPATAASGRGVCGKYVHTVCSTCTDEAPLCKEAQELTIESECNTELATFDKLTQRMKQMQTLGPQAAQAFLASTCGY